MEVGSIWGHGSYVAPDWTADWLHREAIFVLDEWASAEFGKPYDATRRRKTRRKLRGRLEQIYRHQHLRCGHQHHPHRTRARARLRGLPAALLRRLHEGQRRLRHPGRQRVARPERMRQFAAFIFWTAWSAAAEPARRHRHLHPQLAARTAGRQPAHRRERDVDRRQHHHAAGRHLRHGLVVRLAEGRRSPRARSRQPIRWARGRPRRRSAPPSSTSGWSRP